METLRGGFRRLPLRLRPRGGSFVKFLYFREYRFGNSSRNKGRQTPPANHGTALLVTNLSVVSTLEARREAMGVFSRFGEIEDVVVDPVPAGAGYHWHAELVSAP